MKLHIEGMTCKHCVKSVTEALQAKGAVNIEVSLEGKYASFEPASNADEGAYVNAIESIGFDIVK